MVEETPPRNKPLNHVIYAVSLALQIATLGGEDFPNQADVKTVSYIYFSYLLIHAAADLEILKMDQLTDWLNISFNLALGPYVMTFLGCTLLSCWGMSNLGVHLGVLLVVEMWQHLKLSKFTKGFVFMMGLFILGILIDYLEGGFTLNQHLTNFGYCDSQPTKKLS
jgi:hypothetical protein